jgi:hypothetical protein
MDARIATHVHRELKCKHVALSILWDEYIVAISPHPPRLDFKAFSTSRRSASDRDGASGCLSAHAWTFSLSAGESRIGIVSPYLRPAGRPRFLCTVFSCFAMIIGVHKNARPVTRQAPRHRP